MATYQELRARSQQVRDEQNIGGNTALRVGQLLMDIVKYFNDNDAAASEYLQQHFAMVNDGTQLLNWQQSPIVILHTMGETYDEGDFSALSQGENYYRAGFVMEANGQGGGINGETPKANALYVNLANDTLYTWNGASFDAITSGGGGSSISGDDIIKNAYYSNGNLVLIIETESGDKTVTIPVNFDASNYVPTSRTVNNKALSNNITLSQSDIPGLVAALAAKIGYSDDEWLQVKAGAMQAATAVPNTTTVNGKQLNGNIVIGMADIPGLLQAIANAGSGAVSVTTNQDGTFVIHVGETDYTINLNHTHEGMAKLVKCTEATLPQTMADDTIYVQVDNLTTPTEIEALHIFGLEFTGGGLPAGTPQITSPKSTINLGTAYGQGGAKGTVQVKGKNLTANSSLTVYVGSGFSLSYGQQSGSSITIDAAAATIGADVDVFATAYGTSGTLLITSQTDNISVEVGLTSDVFDDLAAVKLTGTQWLQTDYYPNVNTEFELECMLEPNQNTMVVDGSIGNAILRCLYETSSSSERFTVHTGGATSDYAKGAYQIFFWNKAGSSNQKGFDFGKKQSEFVNARATISYVKGSSAGIFGFNSGTPHTVQMALAEVPLTNPMCIGLNPNNTPALIFSRFYLTIYSLTITENGQYVRRWVPKLKNGTPGLYDLENDEFISSETAKTSGLASDELVAIPLSNNS